MHNGDTLVSVIMSVFNGEAYLAKSIESILAQTCGDFEFLITDDGSTDGSREILHSFFKIDRRIKVIDQENHGLTWSLNNMLARAEGGLIARMDADDVSHPERLEKQLRRLERADAVLTGCWCNVSDVGEDCDLVFPDDHDVLSRFLHSGFTPFAHGSIMLRKDILTHFDPVYRTRYAQDFDLLLRISEIFRIANVVEVLYYWRGRRNSVSRMISRKRKALVSLMLTLAKERLKHGREETNWRTAEAEILSDLRCTSDDEALDHFAAARRYIASGKNHQARTELCKISHNHMDLKARVLYLMTFLPGFATGNIFEYRDRMNDRRYFRRRK